MKHVLEAYRADADSLDETDGFSLAFSNWRFNLRSSNTEPLVRLNIEGRGDKANLQQKMNDIAALLGGTQT